MNTKTLIGGMNPLMAKIHKGETLTDDERKTLVSMYVDMVTIINSITVKLSDIIN